MAAQDTSLPTGEALAGLSAEEKRALLKRLLADRQATARTPATSEDRYPLSFAQQRLWFIEQLAPAQGAYAIPAAVALEGPLDTGRLVRSLEAVLERHEILRTRFVVDARQTPMQVVDPAAPIDLPVERFDEAVGSDPADPVAATLSAMTSEPFDLARGPLLRMRLLRMNRQRYVLLICIHHAIADYWSLRVLMREIASLYRAGREDGPGQLAPLPIQYLDYAVWQRGEQPRLDAELEHWREALRGMPGLLALPTDFARPPRVSFRGARHALVLPAGLSTRLRALAKAQRASLFAVLLAALQVLLFRLSGQADFGIGTTATNRNRDELRDLIGLFANNLVLRARLSRDQPFEHVLQEAQRTTLSALAHQDVPFERVVEALQPERELSHNALFQVMFVLHNTAAQSIELPDLKLTALPIDHESSRFDLSLDLVDDGDALHGFIEYRTDLFKAASIERIAGYLERILHAACASPELSIGQFDLVSAEDREALERLDVTALPLPATTVSAFLEAQARRTPDAEAVVAGGQRLSYRELDASANELARHLLREGARAGSAVALAMPRGVPMLCSLLAVLKLGGHYVPLDPTHPPSRLGDLLADAGASILLGPPAVTAALAAAAPGCRPIDIDQATGKPSALEAAPPATTVDESALAYLIHTSGSTGAPKGVPVTHGSLVNLLASVIRVPGIAPGDRLLAVTTLAFDIATLELLAPLAAGASVVIADEATGADGAALAALIAAERITIMQATPATWRLLLEAGWRAPSGFKSLCGGEAIDLPLARALKAAGCELWNMYGPTEATIWAGALELTDERLADGIVPIGGPIANTALQVCEADGRAAPVGVLGELTISGAGLSPGYHGLDALTRERFVESTDADGRVTRRYRTGDLACRRTDGTFVFHGRADRQVKLRGYRIELGEIESVLSLHPQVGTAAVILDGTGGGRLQAWCETRADLSAAALRAHVAERLPAYMVPAEFFTLPRLPLTPNGKLDRSVLPQGGGDSAPARAPDGPIECLLAELWSELLQKPVRDATVSFFAIGGHSLLAARMVARLAAETGVALALRQIFENPVLCELASVLEAERAEPTRAAAEPDLLPRPEDALPVLTAAQYRQWVLARLEPDNPVYNIPGVVRFAAGVDEDRLRAAVAAVFERHAVLRTAYPEVDGEPQVVVHPSIQPVIDVVEPSEGVPTDDALLSTLAARARDPFDLGSAPLMRVALLRGGDAGDVVMLVVHHIACDAWSLRTLFGELLAHYTALARGGLAPLPPLKLAYLDHAHAEVQRDFGPSLDYWRAQLDGAPPLLDLPTDLPRPAEQGFAAGELRFAIDNALASRLTALSEQRGASLFMTVLAAFNALLHRFSAADDIVVGCPVGHRPSTALEGVIGLFVNTLAIRSRPQAGQTFAAFLEQVRETVLDGFAHQDAPFEQVVKHLEIPRSWAHAPLFQVMFLWQSDAVQSSEAEERSAEWEPLALPVTSTRVDLTLAMGAAVDGGLAGRFEYRSDLFERGSIEGLADAFEVLLQAVAHAPDTAIGELRLLSSAGQARLERWNDTTRAGDDAQLLHARFETQAASRPSAVALVTRDEEVTYGDLNAQANALAAALRDRGIGAGGRVGVCLARGPRLPASILGILKTGAAYVPIDPTYPEERIRFIIEDAMLAVVLSEAEAIRRQGLGAGGVSVLDVATLAAGVYDDPTPEATPKDTAYIIYTSGSTGRPKGVAIEHRSPAALIDWADAEFGRERLDRVLASTSVCFDLSVFELFVPLSIGGTVVLVENALADPQLLASSQVTLINTVPTVASELVRQGAIPASTKTVNVAGEPLASALVRDLYAAGSVDRVYNLYGPSEDTTYSTGVIVDEREPGSFAPIGRPIAHTRAYVLDEALAPVAPGFPGELFLAGCGVARGYWNRPELTAERFLPDLQGDRRSGAVMYATGDRVRLRHDGELLFLGRIDDQVKLRGFRIEPGEIEAALEQHPQVLRAAVSLKGEARPEVDMSGRELVAYVVPHHALRDIISNQPLPASSEFASDVREFLARRLPDFMLPARFVALETIPLLPNGKVARQQLPELERTAEDRSEAPRPGPEYAMAELWRPLLGGRMPGRNDNFFALGGDSILALQLVARARAAGLALMPRDLFQYPTIAALVAQTSEREAPTIAAPVNSGIVALSAIQRWFFAQPLEHRAHWNQAVLLDLKAPVPLPRLRVALEAVRACHDALRSTFHERDGTWVRTIHGVEGDAPVEAVTLGAQDDLEKAIAATAATVQARFDLERGPLWSVVLFEQTFQTQTERRLLVICHHLLVDGVSWRILLGDLQLALAQLERMNAVDLPPASTPLSAWVAHLQGRYEPASEDAQDGPKPAALLPLDMPQGTNRMMDADTVIVELDAEISSKLLRNLHDAYRVDVDELLLTGLLRALKGLFGDRGLDEPALTLELEGHGRPDLDAEIDLSRTVGWLTTLYTVTLALDDDDPDRSLRQVKRRLRSVANRGLDDGVRRYLLGDPRARDAGPAAQLRFNYLGQADQLFEGSTLFGPAREAVGALRHPADPRGLVFDVNALVRGGRMLLYVGYSTGLHRRATVEALAQAWAGEVDRLLAHCLGGDHGGGFVDEDFPQMDFDPGELDELLIKLDGGGRDRSGSE